MQLRLLFRADGGPAIGDGHLMRCLALAQHAIDQGGACRLLTANSAARPIGDWRREGIDVDLWSGAPGGTPDATVGIRMAEKMQANFIVADGYRFSPAFYETLVGKRVPCLRFDDTCESLPADIVVNQNPGAEQRCRDLGSRQVLLGCDYVMLRRNLRAADRNKDGKTPRVVITLGGYDPDNLALAVAMAIFQHTADLAMTLVCAGGSRHLAAAKEWSRLHDGKVTVVAPGSIDQEMIQADVAVSAGGTTSLELASLGVPMVIVVRADNQRPGAHVLEQRGCAIVAGEGRDAIAAAAQRIFELIGDADRRQEMGERARRLVDGRGVERVTTAMLAHIAQRNA